MASMTLSFEAVKRNVQDQVSGFSELPEPVGRAKIIVFSSLSFRTGVNKYEECTCSQVITRNNLTKV